MRAAQLKKQIEIVHINDPFIPVDYMKYMFYVSLNSTDDVQLQLMSNCLLLNFSLFMNPSIYFIKR